MSISQSDASLAAVPLADQFDPSSGGQSAYDTPLGITNGSRANTPWSSTRRSGHGRSMITTTSSARASLSMLVRSLSPGCRKSHYR